MKQVLEIQCHLVTEEFAWMPADVNPMYADFCRFHDEWSTVADCPLPKGTETSVPQWVKGLLALEGIAGDFVDQYMDFWTLRWSDFSLKDFDPTTEGENFEAVDGLWSESGLESFGVSPGGDELACNAEKFIISYKQVNVGAISIQIILDRDVIDLNELKETFDGSLSSLKLSQQERASVRLAENDDYIGHSEYVFLETCGNHSIHSSPHTENFAYLFKFQDFAQVFEYIESNEWDSDSIDFLIECVDAYFDDWVVEEEQSVQRGSFKERLEVLRR